MSFQDFRIVGDRVSQIDSSGEIGYRFPNKGGVAGQIMSLSEDDKSLTFTDVGPAGITFSEYPPEDPRDGQMWYDTADNFKVYAWYDSEGAWIDIDTDVFASPQNLGASSFDNPTTLSILDYENFLLREITAVGSGGSGEGQFAPPRLQNTFTFVDVDGSKLVADSSQDTLSLVAGSGITLTPNPLTDQITMSVNADAFPRNFTAFGPITGFTENATTTRLTVGGDARSLITVDYVPSQEAVGLLCLFEAAPYVVGIDDNAEDNDERLKDFPVLMIEGGNLSTGGDRGFRTDGGFGPGYLIAGATYRHIRNSRNTLRLRSVITDEELGFDIAFTTFWGTIDLIQDPTSNKVIGGRRISVVVPEQVAASRIVTRVGEPMGTLRIFELV